MLLHQTQNSQDAEYIDMWCRIV